ncbi:Nucleotidyltransferase [Hypoxylon cercidicola]|nr:Nucleotidyltransferase [Hypoxylon cercidicola]
MTLATMPLEFPTIYLLPTHIEAEKLPDLESKIPTLTYDINEASIILGKISNRERAKFELRRRNILTEDVELAPIPLSRSGIYADDSSPPSKRRKLSRSTSPRSPRGARSTSVTDGDESIEVSVGSHDLVDGQDHGLSQVAEDGDKSTIQVVKLAWLVDCLAQGSILPIDNYLLYRGRKTQQVVSKQPLNPDDILHRARQEGENIKPGSTGSFSHAYTSSSQHSRTSSHVKRPTLVQESTSEHERRLQMSPIPDYLHTNYSCERPTPVNPPNDPFIMELKKVRTLRILEGDEVGVRAYSTAIAALAAYPYLISQPAEVVRLPGCNEKIAALYRQWEANGFLEEVDNAKRDPKLSALQLFYNIWGVAATTAKEFYKKGWRDLDDIVEYGWDDLSRVQQIGVKYYDELQEKIPRREVEEIANVILAHANKVRAGFQMVIVGGYRRGKSESGDVDVILSHPDPTATSSFVTDIVNSLEKDKYITHTLIISTKNSERGQTPVSWKGQNSKASAGFDTLDKALVVWQDPRWDKAASSKNPNPHRRVDIIISPWKTAGCATVGWTGGTTFERDLRRYCKKWKQLKFDSSGVRDRVNGDWVDLESDTQGPAPDMLTAEKRVFERLGLEWRPPEERCTG